jgi:hypothetical protein
MIDSRVLAQVVQGRAGDLQDAAAAQKAFDPQAMTRGQRLDAGAIAVDDHVVRRIGRGGKVLRQIAREACAVWFGGHPRQSNQQRDERRQGQAQGSAHLAH